MQKRHVELERSTPVNEIKGSIRNTNNLKKAERRKRRVYDNKDEDNCSSNVNTVNKRDRMLIRISVLKKIY